MYRILDLRFPILDLVESVRLCVDLRLLVIVHIRVRRSVKRSVSAFLVQELDQPLSHPGGRPRALTTLG